MQTHHQQYESKQEYAKYETLGEPHEERVGHSGFVEVVHKRATFTDGRSRDFILIARGYVTRAGRRVTKSLVTLPEASTSVIAFCRFIVARGTAAIRTSQIWNLKQDAEFWLGVHAST